MWQKSTSASASNVASGGGALVPRGTNNTSEQTLPLNGYGGGGGDGMVVNGCVDGGGSAMVSTTDIGTGGTPPSTADEFQALVDEMRVKDFDSIRFATYRTACKLRFVQSRTNVHLVDIWNMIESFRENGLNAILTTTHLKVSRLELLLTSVFHNLNKRLPATQHIETDKSISTLLSFLLHAYDRQSTGRLTIFSIKVALATLCAGKLVDKLRYIFSQISDSGGLMEYERFADYLQQVLALPSAVFEAPTFGFSESALTQCFKRDEAVNLNQFLDVIMSDLCPPCLMWLPLLHRMASVEHVYHPVVCDACQVASFTGFRYKCQRCTNYQLCQSCFWRGRTSQSHSNEHEMKEYSSYKSPTKEIAHSIQKSLQCVPRHHHHHRSAATGGGSRNSLASSRVGGRAFTVDRPPRPFDLANLVNVTPNSMRHQPPGQLVDWTMSLLPGQYGNGNAMDDEHKLIARYAAKLAGRTSFPSTSKLDVMSGGGRPPAVNAATPLADEHALIATLEEENNEMLRELAFLEQQQNLKVNSTQLNGLRERTAELEARMSEKQQLRRQLMQQLELLMSQLNSVPAAGGTMSRMTNGGGATAEKIHSIAALGGIPESTGGVPSSASVLSPTLIADSLPAAQLQGDLLQAAGAITSNMSNLVQELDQVTDELDGPAETHRSNTAINNNNNNPHNNNYNHNNNNSGQNNEPNADDLLLMPPKLNGR